MILSNWSIAGFFLSFLAAVKCHNIAYGKSFAMMLNLTSLKNNAFFSHPCKLFFLILPFSF